MEEAGVKAVLPVPEVTLSWLLGQTLVSASVTEEGNSGCAVLLLTPSFVTMRHRSYEGYG